MKQCILSVIEEGATPGPLGWGWGWGGAGTKYPETEGLGGAWQLGLHSLPPLADLAAHVC